MTDYYAVTMLDGTGQNFAERRVLRFKQDQYGGTLYYQFYDTDGNEVNLTGGTTTFRTRVVGGTSNSFIGTLTVESASDGKAYYVTRSTDFATSGAHIGEFRVTSSSKDIRSPTFGVLIDSDLPG